MKLRKSVILTSVITIYFIFMMIIFGKDILAQGKQFQFYATCIAETLIIIALYFFLRKKEKYKDRRKE